ncbi:antitoxin [Phenylobacterium terrae]|uniref:Antitoxin n=1 Tax=Phenylobacterium terrae TaxID=2665495 RepID=A0ABW4N329_9CAUL
MTERQRAKLFMHGGSQAVRLPKAFRFEGAEVSVRRVGQAVVLEPVSPDLASLWARLDDAGAAGFPDPPLAAPDPPPEWDP